MLGSLRFRLPAFFLVAIVLAGAVSTAVAVSVTKRYSESTARRQAFRELRREAIGLAQLYAAQAGRPKFRASVLERATGDRIFYVERARGIDPFPGQVRGPKAFTRLPRSAVPFDAIMSGRTLQFELRPPGERERLLAVAHPVRPGGFIFGAIVVGAPKPRVAQSWLPVVGRLFPAFLAGILVAGALAAYLSRRVTSPVLELSRAADEIARGRYAVSLSQDPSDDEIGHLAERFREMAARLAEAEALERNFLMSVSHELRTPLTAIRGHVDALREGVARDPEARAASLEVVSQEADRLERLVGDLLDLARLEAHRFAVRREEVDMGRLVDRAYAGFGEEARRRQIDYRKDVAARPVIVSDGDRVLQIVSNLLSNAFRWTPDGGRVELSLRAANGSVSIDVADTGPGIGHDEREVVFRPFWSRDGRGTGLGLAIARELAAALGGRLDLDSDGGSGSRFSLRLPPRPPGDASA